MASLVRAAVPISLAVSVAVVFVTVLSVFFCGISVAVSGIAISGSGINVSCISGIAVSVVACNIGIGIGISGNGIRYQC